MDQLPIELFPIIFRNLEFTDLIKLREVCKSFRDIIDDKYYNLVDELSVNVSKDKVARFKNDRFWSLDERRLIRNKIDLNKFNLDNELFFKTKLITSKTLINLKYLKIYFDNDYRSNILMHLCYFTKLEVLEITILNQYGGYAFDIIHPNLRKISIENHYLESDERFEINCPQLITFQTDWKISHYDVSFNLFLIKLISIN